MVTVSPSTQNQDSAAVVKHSLAKRGGDTAQAILDATLSVIVEDGLADLTTKLVSQRASVSTASIHYFFKTKDALIYNAFEKMVRVHHEKTLEVRRSVDDPLARIAKSIEVHFSSLGLVPEEPIAWIQFWVHSAYDPGAARLFQIFSARMISNYAADLRAAGLERNIARLKAIELSALTRGLWLERRFAKSIRETECWEILQQALGSAAIKACQSVPSLGDQDAIPRV